MQNFELIDIVSKKQANLIFVDEQICKEVLHVPVHHKNWGGDWNNPKSFNWFDTIGFQIAMGKNLHSQELIEHYNCEMWKEEFTVIQEIIYFLRKNYTSKSYYSVK